MKLAYLSQGNLFVKDGDLASWQIESQFGQEVVDRALRMHQKDEWKTGKQGTPFSGSMLWGVNPADPGAIQVHITGATQSNEDGKVFFVLETESAGGLFLYDWHENQERRLFHKEHFRARDLDLHPEYNTIVCSQYFENGTANIVTMNTEGHDVHQLTEGDSVDEAPSWAPGSDRRIVFQSAGVARNQQGYFIGTGPFLIQQLDLEDKSLTIVLEDPQYDLLLPHVSQDGDLYFIRRPYEMPGRATYGILQGLTDFLMFPFRLLRAIFHFLNFFSLTFSQKPLTTASGPQITGDDEQTLMLRGRMIDAAKALREAEETTDAPSLVPNSWELVRRSLAGKETILAKGVVAFDLALNGTIIYTNGSAVYELNNQGKSRQLLKGSLIENVMLIT